jgi:hypothetical protein
MSNDDADARMLLDWMKKNGRTQEWRALDRNGKPRIYKRRVCEISRNKARVVLNLSTPRFDAALAYLYAEHLAMPLGRTLPVASSQAVELWMVNP